MPRDQIIQTVRPNLRKRLLELAEERGIRADDLILKILNEWIEKHGAPRFRNPLISGDHITIFDTTLGRSVHIYRHGRKLICQLDETTECDHIKFCYTLPEVRELADMGELLKP